MLALAVSLWLVLAGWRFWQTPSRRTLDAVAIAAGVALTAGAGVWVLAIAVPIWWVWMRPVVPPTVRALVVTYWMRAVGLAPIWTGWG